MANLKSQTKNVTNSKIYADLDFKFKPHPVTGDVTIKYDSDAVRRAVRNLVLTNFYERPFKPSLGASLRNQLFELGSHRSKNRLSKRIVELIETFEPRVSDVKVVLGDYMDSNELAVTVFYNIRQSTQGQELEFTVTRTR